MHGIVDYGLFFNVSSRRVKQFTCPLNQSQFRVSYWLREPYAIRWMEREAAPEKRDRGKAACPAACSAMTFQLISKVR
jgi:hypothetical protein